MSDNVIASLASIFVREQHLHKVISCIYNSVDEIHVYLNDYPKVPDFLIDTKIKTYLGSEFGCRGDVGKFYPVFNAIGYVFTLDDDIFYPSDYVEALVERIEYYQRKAFVCVHGNVLPQSRILSYYRDKRGLHFAKALDQDFRVDVPGTGTLAFHSSLCSFSEVDFPCINMSDIWLYKIALDNSIPVFSIARKKDWLKPLVTGIDAHSIYARSHRNDSFHSEIINAIREGVSHENQ